MWLSGEVKMSDRIEKIKNSLIQHGKENDRIYLMKLASDDSFDEINTLIQEKAEAYNYSKLFYKLNQSYERKAVENGFVVEAKVPNFFKGQDDAVFAAKFLKPKREALSLKEKTDIKYALDTAQTKAPVTDLALEKKYLATQVCFDDACDLATLYSKVFATYPFPIDDPNYIKETMETHVDYFKVTYEGSFVAASSAERDDEYKNVEMTDFATLPDHRKNNIALYLLLYMEKHMQKKGMKTLYTIARSFSVGMNVVFAKAGYSFGGTLVNNTNICGKLESMNVWYKSLV